MSSISTPSIAVLKTYLSDVSALLSTGQAREHAYRPALQRLVESYADTQAINEPTRSAFGNPDFVFLHASNKSLIRGYAEAKDITVANLDKIETTEQMSRYVGYDKLILTNYLEFRFFRAGVRYQSISIGTLKNGIVDSIPTAFTPLLDELQAFLDSPPETIRSGRRLAEIMGAKARRIRDNVDHLLQHTAEGDLHKIFKMMRELLVHDLTKSQFADMYAQTLVYGLFVARYGDDTPATFSRVEARDLVPASNPFLREFFDHIVGPKFEQSLGYIVDELSETFKVSDVRGIVDKHLQVEGDSTDPKDPIIHFYEDFLQEYDSKQRKKMGAYYTPRPVVRFIVKMVDDILKREFQIPRGLADSSFAKTKETVTTVGPGVKVKMHRVQILDPAVGTATFLNEVIKYIHGSFVGQEGRWPSYALSELLPRLHGFELMMAPYTIAHLKLGLTLRETGVLDVKQRLGVYLTNTLEEGDPRAPDLFSFGLAEVVSEESRNAAEIKHQRPIMVVMGNPPYSGHSSNNNDYANSLVDKYKFEPGGNERLKEANSKWLNDDYVKFLAFAQDMIEKTGEGVVAMITNHGYIDNPTFRGMRWRLKQSFDKIYILDLHGNSTKRETAPGGGADENVFDIKQGVAIIICVKLGGRGKPKAEVHHADLYGTRTDKFKALTDTVVFKQVDSSKPDHLFRPVDDTELAEYRKGVSITDLFPLRSLGILTKRDGLTVAMTTQELQSQLVRFLDPTRNTKDVCEEFKVPMKDKDTWDAQNVRHDLMGTDLVPTFRPVTYRPFDQRWVAYHDLLVARRNIKVLGHMAHDNLALIVGRQGQSVGGDGWNVVLIADDISDQNIFRRGGGTVFPLFRYSEDGELRQPNLDNDAVTALSKNLNYRPDPVDIMDFVYATLHSARFRDLYADFLKSDFPRIPVPRSDDYFKTLVELGAQLRELHLLTSPLVFDFVTNFPIAGNDVVVAPRFDGQRVWINETQYFDRVPAVAWSHVVGGAQPAEKWLKDRKGRILSGLEIDHYQAVVTALTLAVDVTERIDAAAL